MHTKSPLLHVTILGLLLAGPAPGQTSRPAGDAVEVYARGDYAAVVRLLAPAHRAGEANIQQRLILARALLHLKRPGEALAVLKSVLASDKENPEANALTGRVLLKAGKAKEALPYLKQAHRLKDDPATAGLLGRCHYALGEPVKAKARLEQALAADIRDPGNGLILGKICLERGYGALAEKYLLMAEEAGLGTAELHLLLARAYLMQHKHVGPVQVRRLDADGRAGDVVGDVVVLGPVEGAAGRYKVATRFSALYEGRRLARAAPDSAEGQFILAASWLAAGNTAEAGKHLDRLSKAEPDSPRTLVLRAKLLLAKKDHAALAEAVGAAEKAKAVTAPEAADFYYRAALDLRAAGKRTGALRMLAEAEKRTPTSGRVLRSLATLHAAAGRAEQARGYYARLVELLPDAPDIDELRNTLRVLGETKGGAR